MDDELISNLNPADIQRLSPSDQRELQQFLKNEEQKTNVQRCKFHIRSNRRVSSRFLVSGGATKCQPQTTQRMIS